jgi:8-oxo-dGTP pyrophosphatase MutT (NUDIX family)
LKKQAMLTHTDLNNWKQDLLNLPGLAVQLQMAPGMREEELMCFEATDIKYQSAVLVLLYHADAELKVVLTLRSKKLRKHSGQISFPGGRKDDTDSDLTQTALREAKEEIGLDGDQITLLGWLTPLFIPITGFNVHPLVAYCPYKPPLAYNTDEVEQIIEVRIADLMQAGNIKTKTFGNSRTGKVNNAPYYDVNGVEIWGATAMMLAELLHALFAQSEIKQGDLK